MVNVLNQAQVVPDLQQVCRYVYTVFFNAICSFRHKVVILPVMHCEALISLQILVPYFIYVQL